MSGAKLSPPFLDTNILIYASSGDPRNVQAQDLMRRPFSLSVQCLNEFAHVARRKMGFDKEELHRSIEILIAKASKIHPVTLETHQHALALTSRYNFAFFDALMVACALQADAPLLYSEDMQHRLVVEDHLTILNPFLS